MSMVGRAQLHIGNLHVRNFAGDNESVITNKRVTCASYSLLTIFSQWDIRGSRMAPIQRPLGFSMANNEDSWSSHGPSTVMNPDGKQLRLTVDNQRIYLRTPRTFVTITCMYAAILRAAIFIPLQRKSF